MSGSETFRGFNETHMAPLSIGEFYHQLFDATEGEVVHPPRIVEKLLDTFPTRADEAIERGRLTLRTRGKLPYGLAIFDDRVGIGGYDDETGLMQAFVDTDSPLVREWAERVYASVRADSTPLDSQADR